MNTLLFCLLPGILASSASPSPSSTRSTITVANDASLARYVSPRSSVRYTENAGQWDSRAKFHAAVAGADIWLTATGIVYGFHGPAARTPLRTPTQSGKLDAHEPAPVDRVAVDFVGARGKGTPQGIRQLPGVFRFYQAKNSGQLAHAYGAAEIKDLYPGIDLVSYADRVTGCPRYDLIVHPGADPSKIRMRCTGAKNVWIDTAGQLCYETAFGKVSERRQMAYQDGPKGVDYRFFPRQILEKDGTVGFNVTGYHSDRTLVIDPLVWSTFLGSGNNGPFDEVTGAKVAADGSTFVVGNTSDPNFLPGQTAAGSDAAFVAKFTPTGALVFGVYYGGSNGATATAIGLDSNGNAYATGETNSTNLPVTDGSSNPSGLTEGFVAKFDAATGALGYGKYLFFNDAGNDFAQTLLSAIAVTPAGIAYVTGEADDNVNLDGDGGGSLSWPHGFRDLIVYEISADGSSVPAQFDLGSHPEITTTGDVIEAHASGIALDPNGNLFVSATGDTYFTLVSGYQRVNNGSNPNVEDYDNAFVAKISGDLSTVLGQTYLGGTDTLYSTCIAVDASGAPYVCGDIDQYFPSPTIPFPTSAGAYQTNQSNNFETAFVSKLSADLSTLTASTLFQYVGNEEFNIGGITLIGGNPAIVGFAGPQLPTSNAYQTTVGGGFISQFSADLTQLTYSTFLGAPSPNRTELLAMDVDASGNYHVGGYTASSDYPTTLGAFQPTTTVGGEDGSGDVGVVTVLNPTSTSLSILTSRGAAPAIAGGVGLSFQAQVILPNALGGQVTLSSADGTHVQVNGGASASVLVASGAGSQIFTISAPADVAADTPVVLTATFPGATSATVTVTVKPFVQTLVMSDAAVRGGNPIGAKAYVWETPPTTQILTISSSSPDAKGPATVHVSPGNTVSSAIVFETNAVTTQEAVTATASLQGGVSSASATFDIDPVVFKSAVFNPNPLTAGDSAENPTVTVTLTGPVATQTEFTLTSGNSAIAGNILVTVPAGSSTGTGTVTTSNFVASGESSVAFTTTFTVTGASAFAGRLYIYPDVLKSIVFTPASVNAGANATATVTVTGQTVAAQSFNLTFYYNSNPLSTIPVTIPGGQTSTTVSVPTTYTFGSSSKVYELSGTYNGASAHGDVTVVPNSITGMNLFCENIGAFVNSFSEMDTVQCNVTLAFAAPNGATIPVTSTLNGIVAPFSITVAAGQSTGSATFTPSFTAMAAPRAMTITSTYGTKQSEAVTVYPEIESLTVTPSTINGGQSTTATITLFDNAPAGSAVTASVLSSTATLAANTNPIAITGGGLTYTFTVNANPRPTPASPVTIVIQITGLGYTRTAKLTINPT